MSKFIRCELNANERELLLKRHGVRINGTTAHVTLTVEELKDLLADAFKVGYNRDSLHVKYKGD